MNREENGVTLQFSTHMHEIIYAIVEAESSERAFEMAEEIFDGLVGVGHRNPLFDYYTTFDEEDTTVSGEARFGERPTVASLASDEGSEMFERAKQNQWERFKDRIQTIEDAIQEKSYAELYDDRTLRHDLRSAGGGRNVNTVLYGKHGCPLQSDHRIEREIEDSDPEELWIVPADVHF